MAKINVPQEQIDQIVDLYVNKNYTRVQIKNKLNLSFGDSVIKRILEENNIPIRTNPGAKKGGRKKQEVSREIQDKIIEVYNKGYGLNRVAKELNLPFSFDKIKSILQDNGIKLRNYVEAKQAAQMPDLRKYNINDNYTLESHNGAWLLGFIAADGYLPVTHGANNRITIGLARQDEEVLDLIKKDLQYTGPIYQYENTDGFPASSLSFTSKSIRQKIESYGIGNNKTFQLGKLPNLPDEYMMDFIRGFFDGDGSVIEPKDGHKICTSFTCASSTFLKEIQEYLKQKIGLQSNAKIQETQRVHIIYNLNYSTNDSFKLCDAMYLNNYLALPRKKKHYLSIKEKYSR